MRHHSFGRNAAALAAALALSALALPASAALAGTGGTGPGGGGTGGGDCKRGSTGKVSNGFAIAPCQAPKRVTDVIDAANKIAKGKPYCYGGGHQSFRSSCYDCSGSVSYALHGGRFLDSPLPSGNLMSWGRGGRGDWITVYANSGHAYMVVAGLRFDTSMTAGGGPGWSEQMRDSSGYRTRHPRNF